LDDITVQLTIISENLEQAYDQILAPWIKNMGLYDVQTSMGKASAILPQSSSLQWGNGAKCGQAIMDAIYTVVSLTMLTTEKISKGTAS
jgi:hypothetical protein